MPVQFDLNFCNCANFNRLMQVQPLIALIRFIVTSKS